jgi:hypothetical protein
MVSPISSTLAKIYLRYLEEKYMKHCLEHKDIIYYRRYVDDLLIIFNQSRINVDQILNFNDHIDDHLEFKISSVNNTLPNLDLSITRNDNNIELNIYRKPSYTDIMIHYTSNHPYIHKLAAFIFYINRMITIPITHHASSQEWHKILKMAQNNGFPKQIVYELKERLIRNKTKATQTHPPQQQSNRWVTFTFHGPSVYKITNLLKKTGLKIAFHPTNTIFQQLQQKPKYNNPSGVYQLKCNSCNRTHVGQSGRTITVRHKEHLRYIRNNNPTSAYAMHILHNRHKFGPVEETLKLLKPCTKGTKMNCWEALYMNTHHRQGLLILEQQVTDINPLFDLAITPHDLHTLLHTAVLNTTQHTHIPQGKYRFISTLFISIWLYETDLELINFPFPLQSGVCYQTPTTHNNYM